ncbi:MAG: PilZ domain-containing protein [Gammaproteobacteria bacterium]|nr:PilZ domain-containing protein [Gammaproteobacteria bacterium]
MSGGNSDERRNFSRVLFDAPVRITTSGNTSLSRLIDISLNGALLINTEEWSGKLGDEVELDIALDDQETHIIMDTEVAHNTPDQIGLHCRHIDIDSISHLRRLVELNMGDPEVLERELEALG